MPVMFSLKGPPSNKQGKLEGNKISYHAVQGHIAVLKPIIDKIVITCNLPDPDVIAILVESLLQEAEQKGEFHSAPKFSTGATHYKASVNLVHPGGGTFHIQVGPKDVNTKHALRLEFNPAVVGPKGLSFLTGRLDALLPQVPWTIKSSDLVKHGNVTRLDVAVDVVGARLDVLDIRYFGVGKKYWWLSTEGKLETEYFGITQTAKNAKWIAYNKRVELKEKHPETEVLYGGMSHSRFEFHDTPQMPISKISSRPNPFAKLSVAYPAAFRPKGVKPYHWSFFLDACHRRGHKEALLLLPDGNIRQKYGAALDAAHKAFWKPEEIWKDWPTVVQKSGLLDG